MRLGQDRVFVMQGIRDGDVLALVADLAFAIEGARIGRMEFRQRHELGRVFRVGGDVVDGWGLAYSELPIRRRAPGGDADDDGKDGCEEAAALGARAGGRFTLTARRRWLKEQAPTTRRPTLAENRAIAAPATPGPDAGGSLRGRVD